MCTAAFLSAATVQRFTTEMKRLLGILLIYPIVANTCNALSLVSLDPNLTYFLILVIPHRENTMYRKYNNLKKIIRKPAQHLCSYLGNF